jgi:hypothetical protein
MKLYLSYTKQDRKHTVCLPCRNLAFKKKRGNYAGFFTKSVISMELEQTFLIRFVHDCGKDGAEIYSILMEHYGKDATVRRLCTTGSKR